MIHPAEERFAVEIVVSNFILDNLEYDAELCEDASFIAEATTTTTVICY